MFEFLKKKSTASTLCMLRPNYFCGQSVIPSLLNARCPSDQLYDLWRNSFMPDNLVEFISAAAYQNMNERKKNQSEFIKIVTLGSDFYTWTNKKNAPMSIDLCTQYGTQFSDDELLLLMQKEKMDVSYSISALEFALIYPKGVGEQKLHLSLSKNTIGTITSYLKSVFHDANDVFVPGILMSMEDMRQNESKLLNLAKSYVETGEYGRYFEFEEQDIPDREAKTITLCIPYIVYEKHTSASYHIRSFFTREDDTLISNHIVQGFQFLPDYLEMCGMKNVPQLIKSEVIPALRKEFK